MAGASFQPDSAGIAEMLKSKEMSDLVKESADAVAEAAARLIQTEANASHPPPVPEHEFETDRVAYSVSVPAGFQAVHGVLTKALNEAGLEVGRGKG